jgi:hypothetical protein
MRYRVEIYDANKAHDLTLHFDDILNREALNKVVRKNLSKFQGNVKAYVYDNVENKKILAMFFPTDFKSLVIS